MSVRQLKEEKTRRRRPTASGTTRPYVPQAASTINRPVINRLANFPAEPHIPVPPKGRAQTPYHPTIPPPDDDEEDEPPPPVVVPSVAGSVHLPSVLEHRQRHSEPLYHQIIPPPPPVDSTRQSAFDRPLWSPSGNPLPEPPRDPFNSEAYNSLDKDVARDRVRLGDVRLVPSSVLVERVNGETSSTAEVNEIAMDGVIPPPPVLKEQTGGSPPFLVMLGPSAAPAVGPSQINVPFPVITIPRAPSADQQPLFPPESPERHVYLHPILANLSRFLSPYPHRVLHNNFYPTATYLHEALKYLSAQPSPPKSAYALT
ncbi:hypothetical protein C8R41DRAFT_984757 [Lentinula lateritia]|uniref:Uncharacterized protein n=1 Tax=Lentinula lateritia TaxID=40482 RepID=A0ABQ8V0D2_9AGAR|nr:hypothetical protein C8R41DRAFT_984757 [Lentinula lateritia]